MFSSLTFMYESNKRNKTLRNEKSVTGHYFGIVVTQLSYQNGFKYKNMSYKRHGGTREHGASGNETWREKSNSRHCAVAGEAWRDFGYFEMLVEINELW